MKFLTQAIHVGNEPNLLEGGSGDVVVPIHLSTTFARKKVDTPTAGFDYSRSGNPTRSALEKNLAALESGTDAFAYSSGLAAITNVLLLLKSGDHVIATEDIYGGTYRLFKQVLEQFGLSFSFVDCNNLQEVKNSIQKNTKLLWLESPTNPHLKIVDIKKLSSFAKKNNILTVVDNTFATPFFQKPLDLGADIVVHSATKYLGGHSDVVAGCVIVKRKDLAKKIYFIQNAVGAILSPFDSYAVLKGIKTLGLRLEKHEKNALEVAKFLEINSKISKVYYPGLPSHPSHELAKKQMRGFGGIVSFELKGTYKETVKFLENLKLISLAISLGAVESLIEHPASMTHAAIPKKEREKFGITDTLIRLSVGIENVEDIIKDLKQALQKI